MDVLVIDDDPIACLAVEQTLQTAGYRVACEHNGYDAMRRLHHEHIQLVVCDWGMPDMDGLDICRTIRSTIHHRYVYVVMLTCRRQPHDILEGLAAGADDYVTKPFSPAELMLRVNTGRRIIASESSGMTIFALAKMADSRDPETGVHLERVRSYSRLLAEDLQKRARFKEIIDDDYVRLIYDTSPLHDIGKVAIPDSILQKPGRLTADEFEIMKTHTTHGAQTLAAAMCKFPHAEFLRMAYDIALCHHERFNGKGYPRGISGRNIPLCGRIVALADVYDALTSKRVYKSAIGHIEASAIITAESGQHFDPQIVDAFLNVEQQFQEIGKTHVDDNSVDLPNTAGHAASSRRDSIDWSVDLSGLLGPNDTFGIGSNLSHCTS